MPIDAFPDVTNIQVEVVSTAPGLSPLEIETSVTRPLEMAMRGLPGLVLMRSVTKYGIAVVTLVFRDDVDIYFAREQVHERVERGRGHACRKASRRRWGRSRRPWARSTSTRSSRCRRPARGSPTWRS